MSRVLLTLEHWCYSNFGHNHNGAKNIVDFYGSTAPKKQVYVLAIGYVHENYLLYVQDLINFQKVFNTMFFFSQNFVFYAAFMCTEAPAFSEI